MSAPASSSPPGGPGPLGALARAGSGRRSRWVVLAVWLGLLVGLVPFAGGLPEVRDAQLATAEQLPDDTESARVTATLRERFASGETFPVVLVYHRAGGLREGDRARIAADARAAAGVESALAPVPPIGPGAVAAQRSRDGATAFTVVPLTAATTEERTASIERLRELVGEGAGGLEVRVTGAPALQSDVASAIESADLTLLVATGLLVLALMSVIYRSPIVALIPLGVVGVAYAISLGLVTLYARATGTTLETTSITILAVLMFGAGTDYCLLLVARYSALLPGTADAHEALARATRGAAPAILASGATVMGAMLTLLAASVDTSRASGPVYAIGIGVALAAGLTLLPAVLAVAGRRGFWPVQARVAHQPGAPDRERSLSGVLRALGPAAGLSALRTSGAFPILRPHDHPGRAAGAPDVPLRRVLRRPGLALVACVALLGAGAVGLSTYAEDVDQTDDFRSATAATEGFDLLRAGFPAGTLLPTTVLVERADGRLTPRDLAAVRERATGIPGVAAVAGPTNASRDGRAATLALTFADDPFGPAAQARVTLLRERLGGIGAGLSAQVGEGTAARLDYREAAARDRRVIFPLVLVVIFLALVGLLRALLAPLFLLATVVLSFCSIFGIGLVVLELAFGLDTVDPGVTLLAFIFLVALGVDYTIFLMERVREEARVHGTRTGLLRALEATGPVITSAGLILAGTFAVLVALPLDAMLAIGLLVAGGVLLDTFLVRTVMVPAIVLLAGERTWWPAHAADPAPTLPRMSDAAHPGQAGRLAPGDRVGHYRIGAALGEGGMARVYLATGPDGGEVALKIVRSDLAADPVQRRRFEREVRAAAGQEHPHVVPVLDTGEHDGLPYMVQPFLRGGSLKDRLTWSGPLEVEAAVRLCRHVARGLGVLHGRGIVHRDVKPANILLDEEGRAHVADFGLAKDRDASLLTAPGQALGSLDYMAPEQIRGEAVTPATDVYALGCVAWECLVGRPPFADRAGLDAMWAHLGEEPADPREARADVPEGVVQAILHALGKDPARRPPTAQAFARMLQVGAAQRA